MWEAEALWQSHVSHVLWLNRFEMWPLTIPSLHLIHPVIPCHATPPPSHPTFSFFFFFILSSSHPVLLSFSFTVSVLNFPLINLCMSSFPHLTHFYLFNLSLTLTRTVVWLCQNSMKLVSFAKPPQSFSVFILFLLPSSPLMTLILNHSPSASAVRIMF